MVSDQAKFLLLFSETLRSLRFGRAVDTYSSASKKAVRDMNEKRVPAVCRLLLTVYGAGTGLR
jgi:hypothetical protein